MNLIQRYILGQVSLYSFISVGVFLFVLLSGNALREVIGLIAGGKIPFFSLIQIIGLICLYVLSFALPMGLLCSILMVFGKMSANREIVALKASGVSLITLVRPVFLFALLATTLSLSVNFYFAPMAKSTYKEKLAHILLDNPLRFFQTKVFINDFPRYRFFIEESNKGSLKNIWVWELDSSNNTDLFLKADTAIASFDPETKNLSLSLINGSVEKRESSNTTSGPLMNTAFFEEWSINIPLNSLIEENTNFKEKLSYLTYTELQERLQATDPKKSPEEYTRINTQIQKNYAMAFSVLALVAIAVPLGIKVSRSETYANISTAIILSLVYYFLIVIATWLESKPQLHPDILVWVPNVIFLLAGAWLLHRTSKH